MKHDKDTADLKKKIKKEPDFINSKRYNNSLEEFTKVHPHGVSDNIIAALLCMESSDVKKIYERCIKKLQKALKIDIIE